MARVTPTDLPNGPKQLYYRTLWWRFCVVTCAFFRGGEVPLLQGILSWDWARFLPFSLFSGMRLDMTLTNFTKLSYE